MQLTDQNIQVLTFCEAASMRSFRFHIGGSYGNTCYGVSSPEIQNQLNYLPRKTEKLPFH